MPTSKNVGYKKKNIVDIVIKMLITGNYSFIIELYEPSGNDVVSNIYVQFYQHGKNIATCITIGNFTTTRMHLTLVKAIKSCVIQIHQHALDIMDEEREMSM